MSNRRYWRTTPTCHELLSTTDKLSLTRREERILGRRRDSLVFAPLDLLDRWTELCRETGEAFRDAAGLHVWGVEWEGEIALRAFLGARSSHMKLIVSETKLAGPAVLFSLSTSA